MTGRDRPRVRRRTLGTALWLAAGVLLGGLDLPAHGFQAFRFAPFGVVAGLLGILYVFTLALRDVIWRPQGWLGAMLLVYWVGATAMMFRVLLPPPGLVQAALAIAAAVGAGMIVSRTDRVHAAVWLGMIAVGLAVLRFALVPAFEARSALPDWGFLRFGDAMDALRGVFVEYDPQRPAAQALHLGALACYAVALWTQWEPPRPVASAAPPARSPDAPLPRGRGETPEEPGELPTVGPDAPTGLPPGPRVDPDRT